MQRKPPMEKLNLPDVNVPLQSLPAVICIDFLNCQHAFDGGLQAATNIASMRTAFAAKRT